MAITKKTVPYEILIRFGFGAEHQTCKHGEFSGSHYRTADLLIDDAGKVFNVSVGHAQDVPQEKLASLVGANMASLNSGVDNLKAQLLASREQCETQQATIAQHEASISALAAKIKEMAEKA